MTVTFDPQSSDLPRGTYTATVPVLADGVANSPQHVAVTLLVQQPASIEVSRTNVPITSIPAAQSVETVEITNPGDIPLSGLTAAIIYSGAPGQTWLSAQLASPQLASLLRGEGNAPAGDFPPVTLTLTANTTNLNPNNYSATVRVSSTTPGVASRDIAVQLTVTPNPSIALTTTNVAVNSTVTFNPQAPSIGVSNGGGGALTGLTLGNVQYAGGQPQGWLNPVLGANSAPTNITHNINSAFLPIGVYNASFQVQSGVATNSPVVVNVTLTVGNAPTMVLSRTSVPMSGIPGVMLNEQVNVTSSGAQLAGLTTQITYQVGQPTGWLSAALNSATTPSTLTLTGNTTGRTPGTYNASVRVFSTTPGVAPRDISVVLTVNPGPSIALGPQVVNVAVDFGFNPAAPSVVNVTNGGGGGAAAVTGITTGNPVYGSGNNWLSRVLSGPTSPATVTLTIASNALASGNYSATVAVASPVASNSPQNITTNLTVRSPANIQFNPSGTVVFGAWGNAAGQYFPGAQQVIVTNSGQSALTGLSISGVVYSGALGGNWLNRSISGAGPPYTLTLQPNTTALNAGTYIADVTISSTSPGAASKTITVQYTVQTFTTNVFPFFQNATCAISCHSSRAPVLTSGTSAQTYFNNLINGGFVIAGNANGSALVCRIFGACAHTGGKYGGTAGFQTSVTSWINGGAPFR
jgi:hypothetical protein